MMSENEAILRRWIDEVWNKGNFETIEELFDEDGIAVCPIHTKENPIRGVDGFKLFIHHAFELFKDIQMTVNEASDDGEKVVALCTLSAQRVHRDADGNITKKPFKISGLCQLKILNGKILEAWNNIDMVNAGL